MVVVVVADAVVEYEKLVVVDGSKVTFVEVSDVVVAEVVVDHEVVEVDGISVVSHLDD